MKTGYWLFLLGITLAATACSSRPHNVENLIIKGSDTEVNLALVLAETYMSSDPYISIAVTGGGSGAGIAALLNGKTSIANSSRAMKAEELVLARERQIKPQAIVLGMDAIAIVVHPQCPLKSLTQQQLGAIYRGDIHNWKQLGGSEASISLYGRQSNSGTYVYFRDSILRADYSPHVKQMNGTAQIVEAIQNDIHGIGYVGVGYILEKKGSPNKRVKVLAIHKNAKNPALLPTETANITSGKYPLIRPLFQYTNGKPTGKLRRFMLFCLSKKGQNLVRLNGYFPVSSWYTAQNKSVLNPSYAKSTIR